MSSSLLAQNGKITGKVISTTSGQALPSASLLLIGKSKTTVADQNGSFSFSQLAPGTYSIKCSNISYNQKIIDEIVVKDKEVIALTISLDENKLTDKEVIVTTRVRARSESVASLLIAQKNSASVSDGITAESIRKTPDRSTSDVLKRVSGASIQDDRFAIIRGLNDRYNTAFINGAPLPSSESDRKAFAFDIFPSAILDNLVIYKTATPDRTGDFAGGIIDITTKSILPKSFTSVSFSVGYNNLITGNPRYFSENKGKKDWIGLDDGRRAIPAGIPSADDLRSAGEKQGEYAKLFGNYKWGVKAMNTTPDFNFQISKGFNIERKKREFLGALFSVNYKKGFTFIKGDRDVYSLDGVTQIAEVQDSIYNEEVVLAALANIAVKIDNRNAISWKNNLSINTDNRLIKRLSAQDFQSDPTLGFRDVVRSYTSNQIISSQLSGDHQVGEIKTKINWLAAYAKVQRDMPNFSRTSYQVNLTVPGDVGSAFVNNNPLQTQGAGTMFWTALDENIKTLKADITQPFTFMKNSQNFIKAGAGYQIRKREFTSRLMGFFPFITNTATHDFTLQYLPEDKIFLQENFGLLKNGKGGYGLTDANDAADYTASSATTHAYLMNDQRFFKKLRLIYGVRMERFDQKLNSPSESDTIVTDFLPSVNFVYALTPRMNVRLSFAKTVNRPEFRELAQFLFYDYVLQYSINGRTTLQRAQIKNYDFRYEFFPGKAQLFSFSAFYKDFKNPIEIVFEPGISQQASYTNSPSAEVYGIEAEFRTLISTLVGINRENSFLNKFTLAANAALIKSNVKIPFYPGATNGGSRLDTIRPLQGQSPYLLNGSLAFSDEKSGLSSTVSVNRVGDRLFIPGTKDEIQDIFEKARTVVDFQVAKLFFKNALEAKFTARDLLAQDIRFYGDVDKSKSFTKSDINFSKAKAPKVFIFSVTYKF